MDIIRELSTIRRRILTDRKAPISRNPRIQTAEHCTDCGDVMGPMDSGRQCRMCARDRAS